MNASKTERSSSDLAAVIVLAQLLEQIEQSPKGVAADQYQVVVNRLAIALHEAEPGDTLQAVLNAHPAAAELYENLNYEHAGLCRSPLEAALNAELQAAQALYHAMRKAAPRAEGEQPQGGTPA